MSFLAELFTPGEIRITYDYHDRLNPAVWGATEKMRGDVTQRLSAIACDFIHYLEIDNLEVVDVIVTGSSANYNWTEHSDIDLHIIVDFAAMRKIHGDLIDDYINTKKILWNETYEISIHGFDVEVYVEDSEEPVIAQGTYSILNHKWNTRPKYERPHIDDRAVQAKAAALMNHIDRAIHDDVDEHGARTLMKKIRRMRQAGLDDMGEFSVENLAFKVLRANGYIDKLMNYEHRAKSRALSLEKS